MRSAVSRMLAALADRGLRRTGDGWTARCPGHDDARASLSIGEGKGGAVMLRCHAGCETTDVVAKLGFKMADLMPPREDRPAGTGPNVVAEYAYRDEKGGLLYQVVRLLPKDFRQRRPDGNGSWIWNLGDVRRVLYRLPDLISSAPGKPVFVVEGEKDADALWRLDLVATTNAGGAGKWRGQYCEALRGRHVVILPDNDEPGRKHAKTVALALQQVAASVRIIELADLPAKGDVSDWLAAGGTAEKLLKLLTTSETTYEREPGEDDDADHHPALADVRKVGSAVPPRLTPGERARALGSNGARITTGIATVDRMTRGGFRAGGLIIVAGAPGAFKTTLAVQWARNWVQSGHFVAVLAADESADGLLIRLGQGLGLARGALEDGDPEARADLAARLDLLPGLAIFDADAAEEGATVENVAQWLADGAGDRPAILIVDSLQTVRAAGTDGARDQRARMGAVVTALKATARRKVLVVATCELARGAYRASKTAERTELLASLKESGAIEYGATVVMGLRSVRGENRVIEVETAKNRLGAEKPTFGLAMDFERATLSETASPVEPAGAGWMPEMNSQAQFTADMEAMRQILRSNPGIAGNDRLCAAMKGVGKTRARAAMRALRNSGEIVNRGTAKRPKLHLQNGESPEPTESPQSPEESREGAAGPESPKSPDPFRGEGDGESPGEGAGDGRTRNLVDPRTRGESSAA